MIRRNTKVSLEKYAAEMFSSRAYLVINKRLLLHYGPEVAIFLSNLIDKYIYFYNKERLVDDAWFYLIHEQQMDQTGLSITKIRNCKALLKREGVLQTKLQGLPSKEWYKLNLDTLMSIIPIGKESLPLLVYDSEGIYKEKEPKEKEYKEKVKPSPYQDLLNGLPIKIRSNKDLQNTLQDFVKHRKEKKQPLTKIACDRLSKKLSRYDLDTIINALNHSMENSWTGVFPESENNQSNNKRNKTCPMGLTFCKSFSRERIGCQDCEDKYYYTWNECKQAYKKLHDRA